VKRAVASVDLELALQDVQPLADLVSGSWRGADSMPCCSADLDSPPSSWRRADLRVLAYSVETRRREFGIRIALGARRGRLVWDVLREGMIFPVAGLAAGIGAAVLFTRVLQSSLYETSPRDPGVFAAMAAVLLLVSAAACLGPAWRATRADPVESLRAE
jgi:putative ABC transport system permease protein